MDPYVILAIAIVIAAVFTYLQTPRGKGFLGELVVKIVLGKTKPGKQYTVNDLIITGENGKTSQIDHIHINKNGIFVIETKNYSGRIYGNENQENWTQVLKYGKVKNKLYNPLKQNASHIYRLREVTGTKLPIKSLIVFVQNNTSYIESDKVFGTLEVKAQTKKNTGKTITVSEMEELYQKLLDLKASNTVTLSEHVKNIDKTLSETRDGICPRCNGRLIKRKGKYGEFYGCENYPKCQFKTKDITK